MPYRWNDWNREHIDRHGISERQAEYVVDHAKRPYPQDAGDDKFIVKGQTWDGTFIQVVFVLDPPPTKYVIHARPLTDKEKRQIRKRNR